MRIGAIDQGQGADAVGVVVPAAIIAHRIGERILARVAKGRMADIVRQSQSLGQVLV